MGVHPACSLLVPWGRLRAVTRPWGWDWQSCSPAGAAGPGTRCGWCRAGARVRPGSGLTPRHSSAPLARLRPPLPPRVPLAGGTGLIPIIFSI